jgi:prolyl 4-hydroxylase
MKSIGWDESVATEAIKSTMRAHLFAQGLDAAKPVAILGTPLPEPLAAVGKPVPEPLISDGQLYVDTPDRRVDVLAVMRLPRVVVFGNLLSAEECEAMVAMATPRLARSLMVDVKTGGTQLHPARTSNGMFFERGEGELIQRLEARISALLTWPVDHGEGLQVLQYAPGTEYEPHYDYFDPAEPGTPSHVARGGQRVASLVVYLHEPQEGGGTVFPEASLTVTPRRGNAVFFSYPLPHPSTKTLHGGAPVVHGTKWIATKWLREGVFV